MPHHLSRRPLHRHPGRQEGPRQHPPHPRLSSRCLRRLSSRPHPLPLPSLLPLPTPPTLLPDLLILGLVRPNLLRNLASLLLLLLPNLPRKRNPNPHPKNLPNPLLRKKNRSSEKIEDLIQSLFSYSSSYFLLSS